MTASVNYDFIMEKISSIVDVKGEFVEKYDLLQLDPDPKNRVQVRLDPNFAPDFMVERMAYQMAETDFPPIVVTLDHRIIDGNTRFRARRKREEHYAAAIVVPVSWDEADDQTRDRLMLLGLYLNNVNGKALEPEEQENMIRRALSVGWTIGETTYKVGISEKAVRNVDKQMKAEARMAAVGVGPNGAKVGVMRALGEPNIISLPDEAYRELAQLAQDARFGSGEVKSLAAGLREAGSAESQQERIAREREANKARIADIAHGVEGHPPMASRLRAALNGFLNSGRPHEAYVEKHAERKDDHLTAIQRAIEWLQKLNELQLEEQPAPGAQAHSAAADQPGAQA